MRSCCSELQEALTDECPLTVHDGGIIRPGYREQLDQYREIAAGGKQWIARYQAQELERTGIAKLKVGYNKVFGYYIEVVSVHTRNSAG